MLINSQRVGGRRAHSLEGHSTEAKLCPAVEGSAGKTCFSLLNKRVSVYAYTFTLMSDSPLLWHYIFSTAELLYSYACCALYQQQISCLGQLFMEETK